MYMRFVRSTSATCPAFLPQDEMHFPKERGQFLDRYIAYNIQWAIPSAIQV